MKQLRLLHHRLADAFAAFPERVAIDAGAHRLTYRDLDLMASAVAGRLERDSVSRGTVCAIFVDDRVELIAALLGIMRYGCVFMPLDSTYPDKRIAAMLRIVGSCTLFVDGKNRRRLVGMNLPAGNQIRFIETEAGLFEGSSGVGNQLLPDIQKNDPLYIYFTSGTTGNPKGIVGKHSSLAHFIDWEIRSFGVEDDWSVAHLTSPAFDASLRDFFVPLSRGGAICIPPDRDTILNGKRLRAWVEEREIQLIHCTPSLFKVLNDELMNHQSYPALHTVLLAGEELRPHDLRHWFDRIGDRVRLVNMYGPSETTLLKTFYFIKPEDSKRERLPIGAPISNTRIIILDGDDRICAAGAKGEIYIRTPYRTLGYLNNPEATAESYIPNPFGNNPDDIVYKTGDFGRWLDDGAIEFLGRGDRQVKIRGNRVEMKEIELELLRHPDIEQCLVLARNRKGDGELFLVAYIVLSTEVDERQLRDFLKTSCPDYFVPAYIVPIERIPLTANNKVDTRALPDPLHTPDESFTPPQTPTEERLAGIWRDLFHLDCVGVNQDFFSLGGHSLTAVTLCARLLKAFCVEVPLRDVFDRPTVRLLAALIDELDEGVFAAVEPVEEREYYPLSKAQERMFVAAQLRADVTDYNMTTIRVIEGRLDINRLQEAFDVLIKRHDTLRTTFTVIDGQPVQRVWRNVNFAVECVDIQETCSLIGEDQAMDGVLENFIRTFQLDAAPLLRVRLARLGPERYALFYDLHHIIADAVSMMVLSKEFLDAYHRRPLPPLELQYRDFSLWQVGLQSDYWFDLYAGNIPRQRMPVDFPQAKRFGMKEETLSFELNEEITGMIRSFTKEYGITSFMLLAGVYAVLLARYSGQRDIVIGVPVAGRNHADLEQIIGMFVNILPLRLDVAPEYTFTEFVQDVKIRCIAAFDNQDYPFDELVRRLGLSRQTDTNPLFDVVFQTHEALGEGDRQDDDNGDFCILPYENRRSTSKFSLILESYDMGEIFTMTQQFSTALYKRSSVLEMMRLYTDILRQVLENHDLRLQDIQTGEESQAQVSNILPDDLDNFDF